jgi:hypothetical protein
MRRLKVDLDELRMALDDSSPENHYFFDLEAGKIVLVTDETSGELERLYDELPEDAESEQIAEAIRQRQLEEWQKEELLLADQVEQGFGTRFVRIEPRDPHADYSDMEDFVETVEDARLRERLSRAISGRGAFRYFKDLLEEYPREREHWFAFKNAAERRRALAWLARKDIQPMIDSNDRGE